jgi:hypothetical protein
MITPNGNQSEQKIQYFNAAVSHVLGSDQKQEMIL